MRRRLLIMAQLMARLRVTRPPRLMLPRLIEIGGLAALMVGIGMIYVPAALIVGGIGALLWSRGAEA